MSWHQIVIVLITLLILAALWSILTKTKYGLATLSVSMDALGARFVGIETEHVFAFAMFVSTFLAAIAGSLISPMIVMTPYMWDNGLMKAFVVVIIGGMGSLQGTILAAFFIGLVETITGFMVSPKLVDIGSLTIMTCFLLARPSGILGKRV